MDQGVEYTSYRLMESWWRMAMWWPKDKIAEFFIGICRYAFDGHVPEDPKSAEYLGYFQCRESVNKARAGRKGGQASPKANAQADAEANTEAPLARKKGKKGKVESSVLAPGGATHTEAPTLDHVRSWAASHFCPVPGDDFLADFHRRMTERGWIDDRNRPLGRGWTRALSAWWAQEKKNIPPRVVSADVPKGADGVPLTSPDPNEVF